MGAPRLTFFCELEIKPLQVLFSLPDIVTLADLNATISMGILDLSNERAEVVRRLNEAGIPLVAWLLLPREEGYYFNIYNARQAEQRYYAFKLWSEEHNLQWQGVGLDIEPDIRELEKLTTDRLKMAFLMIRRAYNRKAFREAHRVYSNLVKQIRNDGYRVDVYQFPLIADERSANSTLLQKTMGLIDLPADREVLMLYSSFLRPDGPGMLWSYGNNAQSIGIGSTGGGVDLDILDLVPMNWEEFERDLRYAWVFTDDIHIFSLEGCIRQGYLSRLKDFNFDHPIIEPKVFIEKVEVWRRSLQSGLWLGSRPWILIGFFSILFVTYFWIRRSIQNITPGSK
jgi:hypothetical protein